MKVWGSIEAPQRIEFISYSPEYRHQVLNVIRKSFFQFETVSVGSEINKNVEAQKDLELLCDDVLKRSGVSLIAREVETDKIVGAALNVVQVSVVVLIRTLNSKSYFKVKQPSSGAPTYFEKFRDKCKTDNAKSLINYMIEADSKVDIFEHFQVDSLLEIMFLAVLEEYGRKSIGLNLFKYSVELAQGLKSGKYLEDFLTNNEPSPKLVSSLLTGKYSQILGTKLGFEVIYQEPFANYSFNGKSFAERVGDPSLVSHLAAKRL